MLGMERLGWLEAQLAAEAHTPTIVAMHHPPLVTGIPAMDDVGLVEADRLAVAKVMTRNRQVRRILSGHVHRTVVGTAGGCPVFVCPSTYLQLVLTLGDDSRLVLVDEPPGLALHVVVGRELTSHVQAISPLDRRA
jgi:3',5'-cyclic AMP phosphodiesterase CpdA